MIKAAVYNQTGEKVSEADLNPKIFGLAAPSGRASLSKAEREKTIGLVHFALRAQRNNARVAIAHTKNRGEVRGGGIKPWRQKGTGRARAGSIRSPLWRGGGVTFGPSNQRSFAIKLNKNVFRKALFTVLSDKAKENKLVILDNLEGIAKTKDLASHLSKIAKSASLGKNYALVLGRADKALERAAGNLPNAKVLQANRLNIFDLLKYDPIIMKDALAVIEKTYLK